MKSELWDERYKNNTYAYGENPNTYFKHFIDSHESGNILLPGEGEGRNAVYAASKDWKVTAFDMSREAERKAMLLSHLKNVKINYKVGTLESLQLKTRSFDAIGLIFFHLPESVREVIHHQLVKLLKPGGLILIESFSKKQLGKSSGGPPVEEMLYDTETLSSDFKNLRILELFEVNEILDEGSFHQGEASLTRMIAKVI